MTGFHEQVFRGFGYTYEANLLHSERSQFQKIDIYEHASFGRVLVLDGLLQTTERDEFLYHEMLVHVPLVAHPQPRNVLIIGGGDGGTLRHVLMHPTVERAVMVEIDERVTALCREHMPSIAQQAFEDSRSDVRFEDGAAYVREGDERFDVIIIDSSDPVGPGEGLFTPDFYAAARARLREGGVLVAQSGSVLAQQDELARAYRNASTSFDEVRVYCGAVLTYPGALWSYLLAGAGAPLEPEEARRRADARGLAPRYWTPEIQRGAFDVPRLVHDVVAPGGPPHTFGLSPEEESRRALP